MTEKIVVRGKLLSVKDANVTYRGCRPIAEIELENPTEDELKNLKDGDVILLGAIYVDRKDYLPDFSLHRFNWGGSFKNNIVCILHPAEKGIDWEGMKVKPENGTISFEGHKHNQLVEIVKSHIEKEGK